MPGEHLDPIRQLEEPLERVEEALRALGRADREVGAGRVSHEERVAGEHEPRLVRTRRVDHGEAAVLRPVARRVDAPEDDVPDLDLVAVRHRIVRVRGAGRRVDGHRDAVIEREAAVAGDVICVRVRLDRPHDAGVEALGLGEDRLDREVWIHDGDLPGDLAADEVRGASQVVVQDLGEEHGRDRSTRFRYFS